VTLVPILTELLLGVAVIEKSPIWVAALTLCSRAEEVLLL